MGQISPILTGFLKQVYLSDTNSISVFISRRQPTAEQEELPLIIPPHPRTKRRFLVGNGATSLPTGFRTERAYSACKVPSVSNEEICDELRGSANYFTRNLARDYLLNRSEMLFSFTLHNTGLKSPKNLCLTLTQSFLRHCLLAHPLYTLWELN